MAEITSKIEGMRCRHCVMNVNKTLDALDGVLNSKVEIGAQRSSTKTLSSPRLILKRPL
jgi:copper chaperone CopZ